MSGVMEAEFDYWSIEEWLRQAFSYDPAIGILTRLMKTAYCNHIGDVVGSHNGDGYLLVEFMGQKYKVHRLAFLLMTGRWPVHTDHINGVRDDNRWCNIREATISQNNANARVYANSVSGLRGASPLSQQRGKWQATLRKNGKQYYLGVYDTPEAAHAEYCRAAIQHHGEFARTV